MDRDGSVVFSPFEVLVMADDRPLREFVELEVFLFGGMPELPNPVYGRDTYSHVHFRTSRSMAEVDDLDDSAICVQGTEVQSIQVDADGRVTFSQFRPPSE